LGIGRLGGSNTTEKSRETGKIISCVYTEHALKALDLCLEVCELSKAAIKEHIQDESEVMITSQLNSARLAGTSCLNALKRAINVEVPAEQTEKVEQLEKRIEDLTKIVHERMNVPRS